MYDSDTHVASCESQRSTVSTSTCLNECERVSSSSWYESSGRFATGSSPRGSEFVSGASVSPSATAARITAWNSGRVIAKGGERGE